ncbi:MULTISPECIES: alpha/beta hydrolase [unclassified Streptomyces]|uniref:alpha/beta hydrolase family protein n=1 Tax=unclassified Streptomyces TaxID=2593676 RepID=UPI0033CB8906
MAYAHIPDQVFSHPENTATGTATTPLMLDVHRPAHDEQLPAVLYVHGGGWGRGDRTTDVDKRVLPLVDAGFVVATLDYRLAPDHSYPSPVEDVIAAGEYLRFEANRFRLDPQAVGVWGSSAGASLSTLAALRRPDLFGAFVHYCGPTDFHASSSRSPMEALLLGKPMETAYLGGEDDKHDEGDAGDEYLKRARDASPISLAAQAARPSLVVHGDRDRLTGLADAEALHSRLSRAGSESTLMTVAGAGHDDPRFDNSFIRAATAAFLTDALHRQPLALG